MTGPSPRRIYELIALKALAGFGTLLLCFGLFLEFRGERGGDTAARESATSPISSVEKPTLDDRPMYKGLKPPVQRLYTEGQDVKELSVPGGKVRVGQQMVAAEELLPAAEIEDAEDDPEIRITSPSGTHVGMRYVNRYRLPDGRVIVIRFQRMVPFRPFVGEAGTVHHPFAVSGITIQP
jgi:hypothetical protein